VGSYACACRTGYKLEVNGLACKKVPTEPSPTSKAETQHKWTWIILGIVIGLVVLTIFILVAGVISKRILRSGKEDIAGSNAHEMIAVQTTSAMAATNPVEIET